MSQTQLPQLTLVMAYLVTKTNTTLPRPRPPQPHLQEPRLHLLLLLLRRLKETVQPMAVRPIQRHHAHTKRIAAVEDLALIATPQAVRLRQRHGYHSTPTSLSVLCALEQKLNAAASCASYIFDGGMLDRQS